jgi:hypothetical protein
MITDDEIISSFQEYAEIDLNLTDEQTRTKKKQLFRGSLYEEMNCGRHLNIFARINIIPEYCFDCYKVLIVPRNVIELLKLTVVFNDPDFPFQNIRKCMVENRQYCSGYYKGYMYCRSLKEAQSIQKTMKKIIEEKISPDVSVEVKRGCSEYGIKYPQYEKLSPRSETMQYNQEWKIQEDIMDKNFTYITYSEDAADKTEFKNSYNEIYTRRDILCIQHWLRYAATVGDMSYLKITRSPVKPLPLLKPRPPFLDQISIKLLD